MLCQTFKCWRGTKIGNCLWSVVLFFFLPWSWVDKNNGTHPGECWKSHLLLCPSSSAYLEAKEEIHHGVVLTSVEFTESSGEFRGYLARMACHKNHIYLITSVNLGLLSYKMGCQSPALWKWPVGESEAYGLSEVYKCISVLIIKGSEFCMGRWHAHT